MKHTLRALVNEGAAQGADLMMISLVIVSACLTEIFMPRAFGILSHALTEGGNYDDLRTAFVAAEAVLATLFLLTVSCAVRLYARMAKSTRMRGSGCDGSA